MGRPVRALVHRNIARAQQFVPRVAVTAPGYYFALEGLTLLFQTISDQVWR